MEENKFNGSGVEGNSKEQVSSQKEKSQVSIK